MVNSGKNNNNNFINDDNHNNNDNDNDNFSPGTIRNQPNNLRNNSRVLNNRNNNNLLNGGNVYNRQNSQNQQNNQNQQNSNGWVPSYNQPADYNLQAYSDGSTHYGDSSKSDISKTFNGSPNNSPYDSKLSDGSTHNGDSSGAWTHPGSKISDASGVRKGNHPNYSSGSVSNGVNSELTDGSTHDGNSSATWTPGGSKASDNNDIQPRHQTQLPNSASRGPSPIMKNESSVSCADCKKKLNSATDETSGITVEDARDPASLSSEFSSQTDQDQSIRQKKRSKKHK